MLTASTVVIALFIKFCVGPEMLLNECYGQQNNALLQLCSASPSPLATGPFALYYNMIRKISLLHSK